MSLDDKQIIEWLDEIKEYIEENDIDNALYKLKELHDEIDWRLRGY